MDSSEAIAEKFLRSIGHTNLRYEPDGNIPPDFSINETIGVEVRRLNQADWSNVKPVGLEQAFYPLAARFENLLNEFGEPNDRSYWVSYTFFRPLSPWQEIYPILKERLLEISQSRSEASVSFHATRSLKVRVNQTTNLQSHLFNLAGLSDASAGGFVVSEMIKHIENYVADKSTKIMPYKTRYNIWWLVLVDYIGYGLSPDDQADLRQHLNVQSDFQKIYIVRPIPPHTGFEI
jgi:hypothetical protein